MSKIFDNRINSCNLYVETTFGEYLSFAKDIIKNNELQRKRVRASKSVGRTRKLSEIFKL